jgi:hypothetical protein
MKNLTIEFNAILQSSNTGFHRNKKKKDEKLQKMVHR